jgi:hypothetical protein
MGSDAHKKVKGLLPLASLKNSLHDLAKEQKVALMVVKCINCEYNCHEGDANLPLDAKQTDIKISLRMENKLHHMICPDGMYDGLRMVHYLHWIMMEVGTIGYCSIAFSISSQMVATLTNGYCSIANHWLSTI